MPVKLEHFIEIGMQQGMKPLWPADRLASHVSVALLDGMVELTLHTPVLLEFHAALISQMPRTLRRVRIVLTRFEPMLLSRGHWAAFDRAFSAPWFARVSLAIDISVVRSTIGKREGIGSMARAQTLVERALPRVKAQKRLVIEVAPTPWWGEHSSARCGSWQGLTYRHRRIEGVICEARIGFVSPC